MRATIVFIFVIGMLPGSARAEDEAIEAALAVIRAAESYDDSAVGDGADKTETYLAYERLRGTADLSLLEKLLRDKHPIVRCYAFRALVEAHPETDLVPILKRHSGDTEEVLVFRGCVGYGEMAGDVMFFEARDRLTDAWSLDLLRHLVRSGSKLAERKRLLQTLALAPADRAWIRKLVEAGEPGAIVALARYRNPEDLPLLRAGLRRESDGDLNSLQPAILAAKVFPDPSLIAALKSIEPAAIAVLDGGRWGGLLPLFEALAAFENPDAAGIILRLIEHGAARDRSKRQFGEYVFKAVAAHPTSVHDAIFVSLWTKYRQLSPEVLAMLAKRQPDATLARAKADVTGAPDELPEGAIVALFRYVRAHDRPFAAKALTKALGIPYVHAVRSLAYLASEWKDPAFVEPLFETYSTHWNTHIYLAAARALLCYDDPEIDRRLRDAAKTSPTLQKGWGVKRLTKLLKDRPRTWDD